MSIKSSKSDFLWRTLYRPRILEKLISGSFETWAEIQRSGTSRRRAIILIYKFSYFIFYFTKLARFSRFIINKKSYSQSYQDLFVIWCGKGNVYIDVGAADGIINSNTYLLEKMQWNGVCIEPNEFFQNLKDNRSCMILNKAVHSKSGDKLNFEINDIPTLSRIIPQVDYETSNQKFLSVTTITLNDIFEALECHDVEYLSLDVEGHELEILSTFNFKINKINLLTVEHNGDLIKSLAIDNLLIKNGYKRVFKYISGPDFFWIKGNLIENRFLVVWNYLLKKTLLVLL